RIRDERPRRRERDTEREPVQLPPGVERDRRSERITEKTRTAPEEQRPERRRGHAAGDGRRARRPRIYLPGAMWRGSHNARSGARNSITTSRIMRITYGVV